MIARSFLALTKQNGLEDIDNVLKSVALILWLGENDAIAA
jgi:hypothetical protein